MVCVGGVGDIQIIDDDGGGGGGVDKLLKQGWGGGNERAEGDFSLQPCFLLSGRWRFCDLSGLCSCFDARSHVGIVSPGLR